MEFLNRVTLEPYEQARGQLETLFEEYPLSDHLKDGFKHKLWAKEEGTSEGAFYEMFMAGAMRRLSADCAVEAEYPLNGKPVDLRVSHPGGDFYVECKTRLMSSDQLRTPNRHLDALLDALDSDQELLDSPYKAMVFAGEMKGKAPSSTKFVSAVKGELRRLTALENSNGGAGVEISKPLVYEATAEDTVEVKFYWVGHKRLKGFVGVNSAGGGVEKDETPLIKSALEEKSRQHRNPDLPLVLAINWCNPTGFRTPGRWDGGDPEIEAVFGRGHFDVEDDSTPYNVKCKLDEHARRVDCWLEQVFQEGLFLDRAGVPQHQHVSGVLFSHRTTPLFNNLSWRFLGNPYAIHPMPALFQQIPSVWPQPCEWRRSYEGTTTLNIPHDLLSRFPHTFHVGANRLRAEATFEYQGILVSDEVEKVELHGLLGIDYPERDELLALVEEAQRFLG